MLQDLENDSSHNELQKAKLEVELRRIISDSANRHLDRVHEDERHARKNALDHHAKISSINADMTRHFNPVS